MVRIRDWAGVIAVIAAIGGAACGDASKGVGAGDDVNFCVAYQEYDRLQEPKPESRSEAITYADGFQRILERVDERFEFKNQEGKEIKVSDATMRDVKIMRQELIELRDALRETKGDGQEVRELVTEFSGNTAFREADERVTEYFRTTCRS